MMISFKHLWIVFKSPFNHLVEIGHIYLAPLSLLYLAAILQGKMLPSNHASPSALCLNINYPQSKGPVTSAAPGPPQAQAGQGDGEEHFTPLYTLEI